MSTTFLWPEGTIESAVRPTLTEYRAPEAIRTGACIVVCPGGSYEFLADHEGEPVAQWLNTLGIDAFVLKYRLGPDNRHPAMLNDAARAIRTVRSAAEAAHRDGGRVGVLGFSAGGHLASTISTHFDAGDPDSTDPIERVSSRPDISILIYPVITMDTTYGHTGSRRNLIGEDASQELIDALSNHHQVTDDTPPTYLVHSADDDAVPVENSLMYAAALRRHSIPFEMHAYEHGGHGYGLGTYDPALNEWQTSCAHWLRRRGFAR